jgi:hypothetical protein
MFQDVFRCTTLIQFDDTRAQVVGELVDAKPVVEDSGERDITTIHNSGPLMGRYGVRHDAK